MKLIELHILQSFPVSCLTRFEDGTDSISDQPLSFGTADSSGPEGRRFTPRRVKVAPRSL